MTAPQGLDRGGLLVALGTFGLGLYILWEAQYFSPLGSAFPRLVGIVMLVAAAILAIAVLARQQRPAKDVGGSNARRAALALALMGWTALAPILGFVIASLIGFAAVGVVAKYDRWSVRGWLGFGLAALAGVLAFCFVFAVFLNVPLPQGVLFG